MGKKDALSKSQPIPTHIWKDNETQAPELHLVLNQVAHFIEQLGYSKAASALQKEASKNGVKLDSAEWAQVGSNPPLIDLYKQRQDGANVARAQESETSSSEDEDDDSDSEGEDEQRDPAEGVLVDVEAEETSDDESDSDSDSSVESTKPGQKRKREATPSTSSEESSSSESESSDSDTSSGSNRPIKKVRRDDEDSSSASDTHSDSESESSSSADSDKSGEESSDDSSESSSASDASEEASSSSDSSSSDDESSSSSRSPPPKKVPAKSKKTKVKAPVPTVSSLSVVPTSNNEQAREGSTSSATLDGEPAMQSASTTNTPPTSLDGPSAPELESVSVPENIHPDRLNRFPSSKQDTMHGKKQHVPFSRIPSDQKVDPRFASNDYVSYDYADRAYKDLSVTKGKGFTKEKNKKKRGAYRGGMIDLTPKGIKFND